jgi:hypothetical protein
MKRGLKFLLFLILFLPSIVLGKVRTRSDVINDAMVYKDLFWTPRVDNLLDVKHCDVYADTTTYPDRMVPGSNGIDDRAEYLYKEGYKLKCGHSTNLWPFEVGNTYTGEAYAWGYGHHVTFEMRPVGATYPYKSFEEYLSEGRVAGARKGERDRDGVLIGDLGNNDDFTGIDCSGFITRVWGIKDYHYGTGLLPAYSIRISPDKLKAGDILLRIGSHAILVNEIYDSSVNVIHAVVNRFSDGVKVQRVINENIQVEKIDEEEEVWLIDKTYGRSFPYKTYSAFPQFEWESENEVNLVRVKIRSGTPILKESMIIKDENGLEIPVIDFNVERGALSKGGYYSQITYDLRRNPNIRYERRYKVIVKAKNSLDLEDSDENFVNVVFGKPVIMWDTRVPPWLWYSVGVIDPTIGRGDNTIENAPYFHRKDVMFYFLSSSPLNSFTIYNSSDVEVFRYKFSENTYEKFDNQILKNIPDGLGYRGVLSDIRGNSTTFYFHLDGTGPFVYPEGINVDSALNMNLKVKSEDDVSGLLIPLEIEELDFPVGNFPFDRFDNIPTPEYPPSIYESTKDFFSDGNISFMANAMNNTKIPGSLEFISIKKSANISMTNMYPTTYTSWGNIAEDVAFGPAPDIIILTAVKSINLIVYNPIYPVNVQFDTSSVFYCIPINPPIGMRVELWIEPSWLVPTSTEGPGPTGRGFGLESKGFGPIPFVVYGKNEGRDYWISVDDVNVDSEITSPIKIFDVYGTTGSFSIVKNMPYSKYFPKIKLISHGNTNSGNMLCRISTEPFITFITSYSANTFYYPAQVNVNFEGIGIKGYMMKYEWDPEYKYTPRTDFPEFGFTLDINNVNIDGRLDVRRSIVGENKINVRGYKLYSGEMYEIKTTSQYDGPVEIRFNNIDLSNKKYTQKQKDNITIFHADENELIFRPLETERHIGSDGKGYIKATLPKLNSLFTILVPFDDITPPVTFIKTYGEAEGNYITPQTYIGFDGYDLTGEAGDMSGYKETYYFINPPVDFNECYRIFLSSYNPNAQLGSCENPLYRDVFTLDVGTYTIYYAGIDNAGNLESVKRQYFVVGYEIIKDTFPPEIEFRYPYPDTKGIEKIVSGDIEIKAKIYDENIENWKVEYSTSISGDYILVSSGSKSIDGIVGILKADNFRGEYFIKITAYDKYNNVNSKMVSVYYGKPVYIKSIGRRSDIKIDLKHPYDIVVTTGGYIWISDSGNDRLLKISKDGEIIEEIGSGKKKSRKGERKGDREYRLSKPHGIALDIKGNIYVADTFNHRVVIYDDGGNYLSEIMEFKGKKDNKNLRLILPSDVVINDDKIYILDISYPKIFIYSMQDRGFIKDIDLKDVKIEDDFCNEVYDLDYNRYCRDNLRPYNIVVESGKMILSIINKGIIMVINENGDLIDVIGKENLKHPAGIYLSKYYGYISDMKLRNILRIDKEKRNFIKLIEWDKSDRFIPINQSLDDEGNIWVVDGLGSRIVEYGMVKDRLDRKISIENKENSMFKPLELSDEAFGINEAYVYPNPIKGNQVGYIYVEGRRMDKIEVKIYSIAGKVINEFEMKEPSEFKDGRYVYVRKLEGNLSSGTYYWYIKAIKGSENLVRKGKFSVVR